MNSETKLIVELWDMIRDNLPLQRRSDTAIQMIRAFEEYGFESTDIHDLIDEDQYLRRAFESLYDDEPDETDDDEKEY